ncbi:glycosyltransferase [Sinomonas sp. P10A9]|uniref:Glycosyltransferase n=1 Tax=Sinomonas puerhi TaxID=3238584 RepID=A0AB39L7U7_9MICC
MEAVRVTAVVVAHDGAPYLPATLAGLAGQTRPANVVMGVDAGSRDDSSELLRDALGPEHVTAVRAPGGFGGAVARGLSALPPGEDSGASGTQEWLWLLHDDSAPAPDALAALLEAVEAAPRVVVAGCKQLDAESPRRLIDVGLSVSRWYERLTLVDVDEVDQGQYDARSDMFAVNSAGMLVRRDIWERLGGFDPALPATGDDVDFCLRARLADNRVVVVPAARMLHTIRPDAAGTPFAARRAEVYTRLKHTPLGLLPFHAVGALLGGLWQFLLGIVLKEPALGAAKLGASLSALSSPGRLVSGRRSARRTRRVSRSLLGTLIIPRAEIWAHRRALLESAEPDSDAIVGDGTGIADGPSEPTGDSQHDFAALAVASRGWIGTGALVVTGTALLAALVAFAPLLGAEAAVGGALLPVSTALSAVFAHATGWWTGLGAGQRGHGDPFDLVLWLFGLTGFGDTNRAVVVVLVLAAPIAGIGAWALAANLTAHRAPRTLAALVWAAAPSLILALAQGRLGAVVAHAALPWAALGMLRAVGAARVRGSVGQHHQPRRGSGGASSWTAAAAGGIALAFAAAGAPSLVPLAGAVVLVLTVALRGRARTLWWSLIPTVVLFLPLWVSAPNSPRAWITDPGVPLPVDPAPAWQLVLGQPVAFDAAAGLAAIPFLPAGVPWSLVAALLVGAPVLLVAVAGAVLLIGRRGLAARLLLLLGIAGLAYAWAVSRIPTAVAGDALAAPYAGPSVAAAFLALLIVAVLAADRLLEHRRIAAHRPPLEGTAPHQGARRISSGAIVVAYVLLAAGPVGVLAQWAASGFAHAPASGGLGVQELVTPARARGLPATAADLGEGAQQTRTLVLRAADAGGFTATVMRGSGTTLDALSAVAASSRVVGDWGSEHVAEDDAALAAVRRAVATVGGGAAVDPGSDLRDLGIGFVVLPDSGPADDLTASHIDAVPSLVAVGHTDAGWLWRVTPQNAAPDAGFSINQRARIVDPAGVTIAAVPSGRESISADLPAGPDGRRLVLAERSDAGWEATLNGVALASTAQDWAQAFDLPAAGGHVEVRYAHPAAIPLAVVTIVGLALTLLLAIPAAARQTGRTGRARSALLVPEGLGRRERGTATRTGRSRTTEEPDALPPHDAGSEGPAAREEPVHDEASL